MHTAIDFNIFILSLTQFISTTRNLTHHITLSPASASRALYIGLHDTTITQSTCIYIRDAETFSDSHNNHNHHNLSRDTKTAATSTYTYHHIYYIQSMPKNQEAYPAIHPASTTHTHTHHNTLPHVKFTQSPKTSYFIYAYTHTICLNHQDTKVCVCVLCVEYTYS